MKVLPVRFYQTSGGNEPVREWLLSLQPEERRVVGFDIKAAEEGWPVGLPLCRQIVGRRGLWEIRSNLGTGRIVRVFFCIFDGHMVLLHGFIKKTQKTPDDVIELAVRRQREVMG